MFGVLVETLIEIVIVREDGTRISKFYFSTYDIAPAAARAAD